ncbi:unnamed protein product, partial [Ectocarpus sp. 12 AP-2014]
PAHTRLVCWGTLCWERRPTPKNTPVTPIALIADSADFSSLSQQNQSVCCFCHSVGLLLRITAVRLSSDYPVTLGNPRTQNSAEFILRFFFFSSAHYYRHS